MKNWRIYTFLSIFVALLLFAGTIFFSFKANYTSKVVRNKNGSPMVCGGYNSKQAVGGPISINWVRSKKEENIQVVGASKDCAIHLKKCKSSWSKKEFITLEASPLPVTHNRVTTFRVIVSSDKVIPTELDFAGINLNMGYLRPQLKKIGKNTYSAQMQIPFCEEKEMKWKVSVLFRNLEGKIQKKSAALFYMTTIN